MTPPTNFQLPNIESLNLESAVTENNHGFLQALGAELVLIQSASGEYLSFYWQAAQKYGLTEEKVIGCGLNDTFSPVPTASYLEQINRVIDQGIVERCTYTFKYAENYFPFNLVITPLLQPDGATKAVMVTGCQTAEAVAKSTGESASIANPELYQKGLAAIARNIRRTLNLETIWQQTVTGLGNALDVSRCIICSYKPECHKVEVEAEYCLPGFRSMLGQQLLLDDSPDLSQAITTLEPVVVDRMISNLFQQQSVLVVATSYQDEPNGLICLHQCDRRRVWTTTEIELLRELGDQVGTAIAHATLYKELEEAREQAEEASRLKSEFLANTSHELRTPLNGMIGFLKLILEGMADDPEEQEEFIQEAYRSALHLLNIINDILDIAKIEAGKMELALGQVKLEELFTDVEDFTRTQAEQKKLSFCIETPGTRDGVILYGNYQRLLQVMLNLVGNAIKFTHEGGITISAEVIKKKIQFDNQELPGTVKIRVADTGIGVSLDKQDKLFESFNQVDGSRTRQYGGTGLGLTISQKLVETMGGIVNFYSMGEGLGSTVTFTVPLYQEPVIATAQQIDSVDS